VQGLGEQGLGLVVLYHRLKHTNTILDPLIQMHLKLKRGKKFPPQKKERCHNEHNQPEHNLNSDKDTMASNFMSKMKLKMMTHNLFSFECAFCSLFYFHENPNFNLLLGLRSFSSNHFSWNKKIGLVLGNGGGRHSFPS
jgi:hypothetical protein